MLQAKNAIGNPSKEHKNGVHTLANHNGGEIRGAISDHSSFVKYRNPLLS